MVEFGTEHWLTIFGMIGLSVYVCGFRFRNNNKKKLLRTVSTEVPKEEELKERMREHVKHYCGCTSVHGVKYLVGRPFSERIMWIVVFVVSFVGNSYLVSQVWNKWNDSPVVVSLDEKATPVSDIPFPAVTICPLTKYRAQTNNMMAFFRTANHIINTTVPQWVSDVSMLCDEDIFLETDNFTTNDILDTFRKVGPLFNETFRIYSWKGAKMKKITKEVFQETVTSDGICYTFNGHHHDQLYRTSRKTQEDWKPEGGGEGGAGGGLALLLVDHIRDFDYWCHGITPGFKILLHNPASVPSTDKKHFILESGHQAMVGVEPQVVRTSSSLASYSPEARQCYFSSERYLQNFQIYTQQNCELECRTNYTIRHCGCVNFHMPRANSSIPICGAAMKKCVASVRAKMREEERRLGEDSCSCLPSCTTLRFRLDFTTSQIDWTKSPTIDKHNMSHMIGNIGFSFVTIYYTNPYFIASHRQELYGVVDFLAACGGLIGLFSGFSVLSIVEIIYFLTLRGYNTVYTK